MGLDGRARRRDLIGALAETVLARGLSPLEHTAIDIALTQTVRENDVPILPMVVERILTPSSDADGRLAEDGRLVGHARAVSWPVIWPGCSMGRPRSGSIRRCR